ncbi:MAG: hypothetical protein WC852_01680 [Candidatus Nanoarchaeia archaeon]|jgi:transcription initiation factor TFIIE subunit alpha
MNTTKRFSKKKPVPAKKLFKVLNQKTFKAYKRTPERKSNKKLFLKKDKPFKKGDIVLTTTEIDDLVVNFAGEDVLPLVTLLKGKENVSEFVIADRLNVTVNQVRNMLYRLHKSNLVTFTRKKDKKKGWYIYYWTLAMKNIKDALFNQKKKQLAEFHEKLAKENTGKFYVCPVKCARLTMEDAMEADFHCPECGQLLTEQDNKRTIENLDRRIAELSAEIKLEEDARAAEALRLLEKAKRASARAVKKKPVKKVVKKAVKKAPVKKSAKKAVKKVVKKIVKKPVKKAPVKKAVKKIIVKKIIKKISGKPQKKGFLGLLFAKKKKK